MLRFLLDLLLRKLGLCTRDEYDHLVRGANEALEAIALETARASVYAAALIHNVDDEPHLTVEADAALEHARAWLNERLGRGSGDVLTGARELLTAVDEHEAALDQVAVERIHDALADLDAAITDHWGAAEHTAASLIDVLGTHQASGIDNHRMDDLIGHRR